MVGTELRPTAQGLKPAIILHLVRLHDPGPTKLEPAVRCAWLRCRTKELLSKPADSLTMEEAKTLLAEEEERGRQRRKRKGRIRELEEVRAQLAEKVRTCWGQHAWDVPCA